MISSTFYDLRQVRADLEQFLESGLGYRPLLSETTSFPVDPDRKTIENCRACVEEHADVLVLIVGGRYGSVDHSSDKSVTNLEYLSARAKGIPVYAFVEKRILGALPLWKANPEGDFSSAVDNTRVFEFVDEVRAKHWVWTFEFETAQDITAALRHQFAHLMREGLVLRGKIQQSGLSDALLGISGAAFRLALEQPDAWEHRLFCRVVADEIAACRELRRRYDKRIALGESEAVSLLDLESWSRPRISELHRVTSALDYALNDGLRDALGEPGEPGDVEKIVSIAKLVGQAYREALEWSLRVSRTAGHDALKPVVDALALFPDDILQKVELFGEPLLKRIEDALLAEPTKEPTTIDASVVLELSNSEQFEAAMQELYDKLESGEIEPD